MTVSVLQCRPLAVPPYPVATLTNAGTIANRGQGTIEGSTLGTRPSDATLRIEAAPRAQR